MKKSPPETSLEAKASLNPAQLNETYKSILYGLSQLGEATYEELASFLKEPPAKIWKRMSELSNKQLIYRPGNKRLLKSGRNGFTWMLTKGANIKTAAQEKALKGKTVSDYSRAMQNILKQAKLF